MILFATEIARNMHARFLETSAGLGNASSKRRRSILGETFTERGYVRLGVKQGLLFIIHKS